MRLTRPVEVDRIAQVLAKGACPICALVKNDQGLLLRGEIPPEEVCGLCNFHAWLLAAAVDKDYVVRVFVGVLRKQIAVPRDADSQCSFCSRLVKQEVVHIRELITQMQAGLVLDWMKRQGTFCLLHGEHVRQLAPSEFHPVIDEILRRSAKAVETDLENLLHRTESGKGTGGGVLGRAAEFLVSQRGINQ